MLLRRVAYGESDLVVTLLTESHGRVSALARGARRSAKRFGGALESMHMLRVRLEERPRAELMTLAESALAQARRRLTGELERMEVAGRALGWVRRAAPPRTPEPEVWRITSELLERLDDPGDARSPRLHLAEAGLRLLGALGWGLELERCVGCGRACEPGRRAMLDARRGGLVCRACGGARLLVDGARRARLAAPALEAEDVELALELVEQALKVHGDIE